MTKKAIWQLHIKHMDISALSRISARIKDACNLKEKCFELPNILYT